MTAKRYPASKSATWTVAEAKARFSEVVDRARNDGPQLVTRNGRDAAVIVSADEWQRKIRRVGSLVDFFAASPLRGSDAKVKRRRSKFRDVDLT